MRIRNNKVNVFLSDDEKFILKRGCSKLNLTQSEYIRNLINNYEPKKYDGILLKKHNKELADIDDKLEYI